MDCELGYSFLASKIILCRAAMIITFCPSFSTPSKRTDVADRALAAVSILVLSFSVRLSEPSSLEQSATEVILVPL